MLLLFQSFEFHLGSMSIDTKKNLITFPEIENSENLRIIF